MKRKADEFRSRQSGWQQCSRSKRRFWETPELSFKDSEVSLWTECRLESPFPGEASHCLLQSGIGYEKNKNRLDHRDDLRVCIIFMRMVFRNRSKGTEKIPGVMIPEAVPAIGSPVHPEKFNWSILQYNRLLRAL